MPNMGLSNWKRILSRCFLSGFATSHPCSLLRHPCRRWPGKSSKLRPRAPSRAWILHSISQISVNEAVPYDEIMKTPYGVLCTTAWGGHLSWFETGGGRWFVKPVSNGFPPALHCRMRSKGAGCMLTETVIRRPISSTKWQRKSI